MGAGTVMTEIKQKVMILEDGQFGHTSSGAIKIVGGGGGREGGTDFRTKQWVDTKN